MNKLKLKIETRRPRPNDETRPKVETNWSELMVETGRPELNV